MDRPPFTRIGRYAIFDTIAGGGMATVHLARLAGPEGFSRVVAVKRLRSNLVANREFTSMFLQEARLAARVRHPNVVPILDVLVNEAAGEREILIVMEYVHGESLSGLQRAAHGALPPRAIAAAIMSNVLQGLHAAHEARDEKGTPLGLIHRDVSPPNVMVGADGVSRLLDFGVARASAAGRESIPGMLKGKFSYMAPETLRGEAITSQVDIFAAAAVFWELLTGRRLFGGTNDAERMRRIIAGGYPAPSTVVSGIPASVDRIVMKGLEPDLRARYRTALEMAVDLDGALRAAPQRMVSEWVSRLATEALGKRSERLQRMEALRISTVPPAAPQPQRGGLGEYVLSVTQSPPRATRRRRLVAGVLALGIVAGVAVGLKLRSTPRGAVVAAQPRAEGSTTAAVVVPDPRPSASPPAVTVPADDAGSNAAIETMPQRPQQPVRRPTAKPSGPSHAKQFLPENL